MGLCVGFLSGMFGKGGSAIATPILHFVGVSSLAAVASPLPATVPSTLVAAYHYWQDRLIDWRVVGYGFAFGIPATVAGALATRWTSGDALILITDVVVVLLALRILIERVRGEVRPANPPHPHAIGGVAILVGLIAGLLANSGGFLLAPLLIVVLGMQTRQAFGSSLVLSAGFAIPGTIVHAALGHVDWHVTLIFAVACVPLSAIGARVALRTHPDHLEWMYALLLLVVGGVSLVQLA